MMVANWLRCWPRQPCPLDAGDENEQGELLRERVSALEEVLGEEASDGDAISEAGSAVLATIVSERRGIGEQLDNERKRADAAEQALRQLAGAAANAAVPEGVDNEDELGEAVLNLRRDLDASAELNPDGAVGVVNDLSVDGVQVIAQLVDDRKEAERQANSAQDAERRIATSLLDLCNDSNDEEVQIASESLKKALNEAETSETAADDILAASAKLLLPYPPKRYRPHRKNLRRYQAPAMRRRQNYL